MSSVVDRETPPNAGLSDGPGGVPSFAKHIVPMFNRQGCSTRECHGSFQGQNGFRLSLFGYDLKLDHAELTTDENDDGPRPRLNLEKVDESLALLKPLDEIDHEGGQRLERDTWQFRMFRDWIAAGAPFDAETEPYLKSLELQPPEIRFDPDTATRTQLRLLAHFSDGDLLDVTALTNFSSNDEGIARVDKAGQVSAAAGLRRHRDCRELRRRSRHQPDHRAQPSRPRRVPRLPGEQPARRSRRRQASQARHPPLRAERRRPVSETRVRRHDRNLAHFS